MTARRSRPHDVKWSFEHYRGAWGEVLHKNTDGVEIVDDHTVRFHFKEPFFDFPILLGTGNVCGAGWVVPAKYYEQVGQAGFMQKPIGAGPYKLVSQQPGVRLDFEAFEDYYRPVHVKQLTMIACRKRRPGWRCSSAAKPTSCISCPAS